MPKVARASIVDSDLLEIWLYVAEDNPSAADKLLDRIDATCQFLSKSPHAGRARPELGMNIRSHPVGRYVIYYRTTESGIELIRVLSGYRDLDGLL